MKKYLKLLLKGVGWFFQAILGLGLLWFMVKFACYLLLIGLLIFNLSLGGESEMHYLYDFKIESMKDNHTYVVSRYGGDSELEYHFIREIDGALHTGSTDASYSSIVEDSSSGKVEVFIEVPKIGTNIFVKLGEWASIDGDVLLRKEYVYHIPEGSVETGEFNIDLE